MSKLSKPKREEAISIMLKEYKGAKCALDYTTNFSLLVAVVLSAQTTDVAVNRVTPALFTAFPDAFSMANAKASQVEKYIKSIGLYKNKTKNVILLSRDLVERFNGEIPDDFESLVSLPGVGRKTANVVLAELFGHQTIAVDTHVFRLANRIGLVCEDNVLSTELSLQKVIVQDSWTKMHHALIWHGRKVCTSRNPNCSGCCLDGLCKKNGI